MLDLLFGKAGLIAIGVTACLAILGTMFGFVRKAGVDAQKVKEADAYAKHLQDIQNAANARPVGLPDNDPNNRDKK